jgi:uncharacterized protein YndB with AHSA1/START domain
MKTKITVETTVKANIDKVWNSWTLPEHIIQWNSASNDWHTPSAQNDLRVGGRFIYRMEAKDKSMGFDFGGVYTEVIVHRRISYSLGEDRSVDVDFIAGDDSITVSETFLADETHPIEAQKAGWLSILENFRKHVESNH